MKIVASYPLIMLSRDIKSALPRESKIMPLRQAAVMAGLGIIRKNNFFYTEKGSAYELEGYLIDQDLSLTHDNNHIRPCADACTLCQQGCKTIALCAPYTMNPLHCVSFINTFGDNKVPLPLKEESMQEWIMGCENCQDVCPHNRLHDWSQGEPFKGLDELVPTLAPQHILVASDEELIEKVLPKSASHIRPNQVDSFRKGAERALRYQQLQQD